MRRTSFFIVPALRALQTRTARPARHPVPTRRPHALQAPTRLPLPLALRVPKVTTAPQALPTKQSCHAPLGTTACLRTTPPLPAMAHAAQGTTVPWAPLLPCKRPAPRARSTRCRAAFPPMRASSVRRERIAANLPRHPPIAHPLRPLRRQRQRPPPAHQPPLQP